MKCVLEMAAALRPETMWGMVALLRHTQTVHFLLAATELHLAVHGFGPLQGWRAGAATAAAVATRGSWPSCSLANCSPTA